MRTGRERLIEWVEEILYDSEHYNVTSVEEWADRIMEDINLGIITAEVDG